MKRWWLILGLVAGLSLQAAERRILEVEEFEGLVRYPYHWNEAPGWYARESNCRFYGAPGKGYHAQIHEKAKFREITRALQPPLPAGRYKVFLRATGNNWHDRDNIVEVRLGSHSLRFAWQGKRRFEWLPGQEFTSGEPITSVTLAAVQFGGKGFRQLYESNLRTLAVDTLYLTSDLTETTGPAVEGALLVEAGREAPVEILSGKTRPDYREVLQAETPEPCRPARVSPVKLQSFDGRRNLWPNSSFEIGGNDGWFSFTMNPERVHIFDERDHIRGQAYHGQYCLRIPANMCGTSRPVYLARPGKYTFSLTVKGQPGASARVLLVGCQPDLSGRLRVMDEKGRWLTRLTIPVSLTEQWQRVSASAELPEGFLVLRVESAADCFLDAVMLEPGTTVTTYQPRAAVEAGLTTGQMGEILYDNGPTQLVLWASNSSPVPVREVLVYDVVDVRENTVASGEIALKLPANSTLSRKVTILKKPQRGLFSCFYSLKGRSGPEGELIYAVLPEIPQGMPRHALACNMDNVEEVFRLMSRMGHKWQLYCKTAR
ncbi:MAG TPA: hypothetical protein PKW42_08865, partial [bacterium]|nr:hypothetical protein [bacterium]